MDKNFSKEKADKFDELLKSLDRDDQQRVINASKNVSEFASIIGEVTDLSPEETMEQFDNADAYLESLRASPGQNYQKKDEKEGEEGKREEHVGHHRDEGYDESQEQHPSSDTFLNQSPTDNNTLASEPDTPDSRNNGDTKNITDEKRKIEVKKVDSKPASRQVKPRSSASINSSHPQNVKPRSMITPIINRINNFYIRPRSNAAIPHTPPPSPSAPRSRRLSSNFPTPLRRGRTNRRHGSAGHARAIGNRAAKKGAKSSTSYAAGLLAANWEWVAIGAAIIVGIVLFFVLLIAVCSDPLAGIPARLLGLCPDTPRPNVPLNPPGVTTVKDFPTSVGNNENIEYKIFVTYDPNEQDVPNPEDINIFDVPLYGHLVVNASGKHKIIRGADGIQNHISWNLLDNVEDGETFDSIVRLRLVLTLNPTSTNFIAINSVYAAEDYIRVTSNRPGAGGFGGSGDYDDWDDSIPAIDNSDLEEGIDNPPSNLTCGGKYTRNMNQLANNYPTENDSSKGRFFGNGTNFGDPICSYTRQKLKRYIEQEVRRQYGNNRPALSDFYFLVARCEAPNDESGPNAFRQSDQALGHFQMSRSFPRPGKPYDNSDVKRGDVTWQNQIKTAIRRNRTVNDNGFTYWAAARCLCSNPDFASQGYCNYLTNNNTQSELDSSCTNVCKDIGKKYWE